LSIEAVKLMGANVLWAAKAYDPYCGGRPTFATIDKSGKHSSVDYDWYHAEQFLTQYEADVRSLLFFIGNPTVDQTDFDQKVADFTEAVKNMRMSWRLMAAAYRNAADALREQAD
jgi:hypothetical protein